MQKYNKELNYQRKTVFSWAESNPVLDLNQKLNYFAKKFGKSFVCLQKSHTFASAFEGAPLGKRIKTSDL